MMRLGLATMESAPKSGRTQLHLVGSRVTRNSTQKSYHLYHLYIISMHDITQL